ncbi:MAG: DEAD/DEAH box helicase family protein [Planctomycetota bacterium]
MITLEFDRGTVLIKDTAPTRAPSPSSDASSDGDGKNSSSKPAAYPEAEYDPRVQSWRAPARAYRKIVEQLVADGVEFDDKASVYERPSLTSCLEREPFPHQREAVDAWRDGGRRGVVVLPTGAGKTFVAQLAMESVSRATLVVTPTIDLMNQWYSTLATGFDRNVGLIGGGYYDVQDVTVTTYDSAWIHMEDLGARFGLLVFDECHHLPGPSYQLSAECSLAPYRLGLTATPEREDGMEYQLEKLIGPEVYRKEISELAGEYLAEYETLKICVRLGEDERNEYLENREVYLNFVRENGIHLGGRGGWTRFLMLTSRSEEGRKALLAYRRQKSIAQGSEAKIRFLHRVFDSHRGDRVLIFTSDNDTVYRISRRFLIPAITHQTKIKERHDTLKRFNEGSFPFLVTSKVLNEGVDVPAANVAVVLSGSGSVREHVQRLGRILRRAENKRATLYEVIAEGTAEEYTSQRRRQHDAYN